MRDLSSRLRKLSGRVQSLEVVAAGQEDAAEEIPIYEASARATLFCLAAKENPEAARDVIAGLDPALATLMRERMKVDTSSPGEDVAAIKKLLPLRRQDEDAMRAFVEVCREQERERKAAARQVGYGAGR